MNADTAAPVAEPHSGTSVRAWAADLLHVLRPKRRAYGLSPGRRVYAIGDVHGRLDLLEALLATIEADDAARPAAQTEVILLGDLIDRGPSSRGVIRRAMTPLAWAGWTVLMGNHEAMLIDILDGATGSIAPWLAHGGQETMLDCGVDPAVLDDPRRELLVLAARDAFSAEEIDFLRDLPLFYRIDDYLFVHAGIRPAVAIEQQVAADLLWIREDFLDSRRDHGLIVVHGHSVVAEVEQPGNRVNVDTGAYRSGRLSAVGLEDDRRWILST